jgi:octaprenyl-diphosphate synthase
MTGAVPHPFHRALESMADGLEQVERAMRDQLHSRSELLPTLGEHVLSSGGKRMRPALLLLSAELCGYTGPRRIQIAAAVELLHTATLLHDDVVDDSYLRRGRPSANALWGNRRAILAGDFFYARASGMVVEDGEIEILRVFADTIRLITEGEILQLQKSFDADVTEQHYYAVIERKSATLLSAACEAGSILGGVTRAERSRIAEYGRELGLAFQLRDDAIDYEAREAESGKTRYGDLREGKVTLPLLLALKRSTPAEREVVVAAIKSAARRAPAESGRDDGPAIDERELLPVVEIVKRHRGSEDTTRRAREHAERAAAAIAPFPPGVAKDALLHATDFVVARQS